MQRERGSRCRDWAIKLIEGVESKAETTCSSRTSIKYVVLPKSSFTFCVLFAWFDCWKVEETSTILASILLVRRGYFPAAAATPAGNRLAGKGRLELVKRPSSVTSALPSFTYSVEPPGSRILASSSSTSSSSLFLFRKSLLALF